MTTLKNILHGTYVLLFLIAFNYSFALGGHFGSSDATDLAITSAIQHRLVADNTLSDAKLKIVTSDRIVVISGLVNSDTQANTAVEIAKSIKDVKEVDLSGLIVKGSTKPVDDAMVTAEIKKRFIQKKLFGDEDIAAVTISVETNNGVVSLSGKADNEEQVATAISIARTVPGVQLIKSNVQVHD